MNNQRPPTKLSYRKPEVRRIDLRPQEAVLGFCKSASVGAPGNSTCSAAPQCFTSGS
jgi:hypothetical protein